MTPGANLGVVFHSDNGGASYGGQITIQTPGEAGPIATGLWDSDGDVYFDVVLLGASTPASCTIDAASIPGSWEPYNRVAAQAGLQCTIVQTGHDPSTNTYDFDLQITVNTAAHVPLEVPRKARKPGVGAGAATAPSPSPSSATGAQEYVFNVALLDGSPLGVWQPGTLALQVNGRSATGSLRIPGFYQETMAFAGTVSQGCGQAGSQVCVSGATSEMSGDLGFLYKLDGFLTNAVFLGGTASILDNNAQETYLYVLQGSTEALGAAPARTPARRSRV